jgi:hypothetical protein
LLGAMAVGQALSWKDYVSAVQAHGVGLFAPVIASMLFMLEVVVALGLLLDVEGSARRAAGLAVLVTAAWGVLGLQAFIRRRNVPNCACFGRFMRQPLRWWVLLEDVAFVGLAVWHLRGVA